VSENQISFFSKVPFFSEISNKSLQLLCSNIILESFKKGEVIFEKNSIGNSMYVIFKGSVKIHDKAHIFNTLSKNDCFGEYALIDNEIRSATVTVIEDTDVYKIEGQNILDLIKNDLGFAKGILSVLIKRHRKLDETQLKLVSSKLEVELANSKMSGLINGAMDAIIMFNSNFRIVLTNPAANKLLENEDVLQRNVLFFLDEKSADLIESLIKSELEGSKNTINKYIPSTIKIIGSNNTETLNEGTISKYGTESNTFYTLILRNIEDRLLAQDTISQLTKKTECLEKEIEELTGNFGIIAENKVMKAALNLIHQVAKTDATVLITGETGTGKELVARAIHKESNRSNKPLIKINCGAIPVNLIESELFGHEKGAFTGATECRKGRFLLADKGTIFLDEIGEMPIELQPKLLRVIQEGEFESVGSSKTIKVDVRIIAATHRNLLEFSKEGKFREDLYYRLNVFPIKLPALRERGSDICLIAQKMIHQISKKLNKASIQLSDDDKFLFSSYNWPGNVRELQNLIERGVIISQNGNINWQAIIPNHNISKEIVQEYPEDRILTANEICTLEKENILKALKICKWKISGTQGAAALLQIPPTTLASKIKVLGIERPV